MSKCVFGTLETSFVGFRVNRYGIHTEEKKVKAVWDWAILRTPTELRGFLGLAGYYRKFVPKFAQRAICYTTLQQNQRMNTRGPNSTETSLMTSRRR